MLSRLEGFAQTLLKMRRNLFPTGTPSVPVVFALYLRFRAARGPPRRCLSGCPATRGLAAQRGTPARTLLRSRLLFPTRSAKAG